MPVFETIDTQGVPVHVYATDIDANTRRQLVDLANSGFVVGHVAAMPDTHFGRGATIGSVFASATHVCPNAVGTDIGCGMGAIRLAGISRNSLTEIERQEIHRLIKQQVPTGFEVRGSSIEDAIWDFPATNWLQRHLTERIRKQLGTLGGGNHFIELVYDDLDRVWIMLHSGSRAAGKLVADYYTDLARAQMTKFGETPRNADLWALRINTEAGRDYLTDMLWCQAFAAANRRHMLNQVALIARNVTGATATDETINIHHNFCQQERHQYKTVNGDWVEEDLWITRKGATPADEGRPGLIPGSMATGSYIVRGLGNPMSWQSCSHGAGRRKSRTAAMREISQEDFEAAMQGITAETDPELRDEAPQAYKDLHEVMANQADLVTPVHRLLPLVNVKGFEKRNRSGSPSKSLMRTIVRAPVVLENNTGVHLDISGVEVSLNDGKKFSPTVVSPAEFTLRVQPGLEGAKREIWVTARNEARRLLIEGVIREVSEERIVLSLVNIRRRGK